MALTDRDRELVAQVRRGGGSLPFGAGGALEAMLRFDKPAATDRHAIEVALGRAEAATGQPRTEDAEFTRRFGATEAGQDETQAQAFWARFNKETT